MLAALLALASPIYCDKVKYETYQSYQSSVSVEPGVTSCIFFDVKGQVVSINRLGMAVVSVYTAATQDYFLPGMTLQGVMDGANRRRIVSFGNSYGCLVVKAQAHLTMYYSYIRLLSSCSEVAVSNRRDTSFSLPNSSLDSVNASKTYCFYYLTEGDMQATAYLPETSQTLFKYQDNVQTAVGNGTSFLSSTSNYPLHFSYTPANSTDDLQFSLNLTSQGSISICKAEGMITDTEGVVFLTALQVEADFVGHEFPIGLIIGPFVGSMLVIGAAFTIVLIKRRKKLSEESTDSIKSEDSSHRKADISKDAETTVPYLPQPAPGFAYPQQPLYPSIPPVYPAGYFIPYPSAQPMQTITQPFVPANSA